MDSRIWLQTLITFNDFMNIRTIYNVNYAGEGNK